IPSVLYAHLPQLIATASLAFPSDPTIRLIALPHGAGKRMSIVLQISRVGIVGLLGGAPHAAPLIELIREHVPPVEVPWLDNLRQGNYLPVGINSTKTVAFNKPEMSSNDRKDSRLETLKQQSELAGT
ncbi:hypothetical protein MMC13_001873, partial [Lambiella insularis]|nr:hypothetical protein [Lambiella insularis]